MGKLALELMAAVLFLLLARVDKDVAYTQQEAKQIIDANTAEDNAALMRLAERRFADQMTRSLAPNVPKIFGRFCTGGRGSKVRSPDFEVDGLLFGEF